MANRDNLDALVSALNAGAPRAAPPGEETARLRAWIEHVEIGVDAQSLAELVKQGLIERTEAIAGAGHPEELERLLS